MPRPNGPQFRMVYDEFPDNENERHMVSAVHADSGEQIGNLTWSGHEDTDYGHIQDVQVAKKYRRHGIATAMLREAQIIAERNPTIQRPEHGVLRTPVGDKWAQSTGDWVPKNQR